MKKDDKALSKRYPGLWTILEVDGAMVRARDSRGNTILTTLLDLTPYSTEAITGLKANDAGMLTITWLQELLAVNKPEVYIAMEQAGYNSTQVFTDLMTIALDGVITGGADLPTVLTDALFAVAAKRNDLTAKQMAEELLRF